MVFIQGPFTEGDCYIGDPSDLTHGGKSRLCRKCHELHCERHRVELEGQRYCVRCSEAARPDQRGDVSV